MSSIKSFEDIEAWRIARVLSKDIYGLTLQATFANDWGLKDQINRASGSIMDNIAEGFERGGTKEFIQFLAYAKGSAGEVSSQLHRAFDRNHLDEKTFTTLNAQVLKVSKMITNFIIYLKNSEMKGMKFKEPQAVYGTPNHEPQTTNHEPVH